VGNEARPGAFGLLLRRHRSIAGLTQEELAKRSGLSLRALSDMERGRTTRPSLRSARLLAQALELSGAARTELMAALQDGAEGIGLASSASREQECSRPEVPRQLPGPVRHFVGRSAEMQALTRLLERDGAAAPRTAAITAIAGTAGLGKTALAVHWSHQAADQFPDGQLYVNLRGYDTDQPLDSGTALAGFLRSLGVAEHDIPAETTQRAARYRSILAGRQVLVLLDNASDAEQVRPLLPGSPSCAALVTSRDALAGLVALDGAERLELDLLDRAEAVGLLQALIGERAQADPRATAELAERCARLPLALRVAAERAAASAWVPLAELADELADQQRRLDLLDTAGDPRTAVRTIFSWSLRHLDDGAARAFRLLGLHPGVDFDIYALAALIGGTAAHGRRLMDRLAHAYLIQPVGLGRYGMHDLLRSYAAEQAAELYSAAEQRAAATGLFNHYLGAATAVADIMYPADPDRPQASSVTYCGPKITSCSAAWEWLDAERANLLAIAAHAVAHGRPAHTIRLAATAFRYTAVGHYGDAVAMHSLACRAAAQTGMQAAEGSARIRLAEALAAQGHLRRAGGQLKQASRLCREAGDRVGEARALINLGAVAYCQGHYEQAVSYEHQALDLCCQTGDWAGEARAMMNLSAVDLRQARHLQAAEKLRKSMALYSSAGIQAGVAHVLSALGDLEMRQGHLEAATDYLGQSLALCRETADRLCEARTLTRLGLALSRQGRHECATSHLRQALVLHAQADNRGGQAETLNGLGEALIAAGQTDEASAHHSEAMVLAGQLGDKYEQARAHHGLASGYQACGDNQRASHHWRRAFACYTEIGAPEAAEVRTKMAACGLVAGAPARPGSTVQAGALRDQAVTSEGCLSAGTTFPAAIEDQRM
jgi:tetratricopeptide (TPR) repeat protein/transcriptional regulator with XRE-family HTH domain